MRKIGSLAATVAAPLRVLPPPWLKMRSGRLPGVAWPVLPAGRKQAPQAPSQTIPTRCGHRAPAIHDRDGGSPRGHRLARALDDFEGERCSVQSMNDE